MKKLSSTQAMAVMLFTASTYANAGIGTKIKSALNNVGTELVIAGAGVLFVAVVLIAINMFFTPIRNLKTWVCCLLVGGVILVFAEDIVNWILTLSGSSGY